MDELLYPEKMKTFNYRKQETGNRKQTKLFRKFANCILLIASCLLPVLSNAQNIPVLTLDSVLNRIERDNPMLKMYDEQINAINNYSQGAKSWMPTKFSTGPWQTP